MVESSGAISDTALIFMAHHPLFFTQIFLNNLEHLSIQWDLDSRGHCLSLRWPGRTALEKCEYRAELAGIRGGTDGCQKEEAHCPWGGCAARSSGSCRPGPDEGSEQRGPGCNPLARHRRRMEPQDAQQGAGDRPQPDQLPRQGAE